MSQAAPQDAKAQPSADARPRIERIERNTAGQLVATVAGRAEPYVDVRVVRCFPWSVPDMYISVRDNAGKEIVLLGSLDELDRDSRRVVEQELAEKVFNPKIRRITEFKDDFGVTSVTAETDRGEVTFQLRSRDDVRLLSSARALFRDADGNTYELEDYFALDPASRKFLQVYF